MRKFFQDLLGGKYAINYTVESIKSMVPREIKWLNSRTSNSPGDRLTSMFNHFFGCCELPEISLFVFFLGRII
jgi:hypothetical protein